MKNENKFWKRKLLQAAEVQVEVFRLPKVKDIWDTITESADILQFSWKNEWNNDKAVK